MTHIKKLTKFAFLFLLLLSLTTSCNTEPYDSGNGTVGEMPDEEVIPDTFSEYFGNDITRNFLGTIIDINKNPIEGVTVTIGNDTAMTDSNGVFIINNANVKTRFGYVKASKSGYIHGSRAVVPSDGTNKVTIMLLAENVIGTVNSGVTQTVTMADGSSVSFDGNFIQENGTTYSGSVDVIMHRLNPTDEDMPLQMPGMLYAENTNGAERMLQTLGMLAVELRGTSGEELNLAEGSTSELKFPVDSELMGSAPATIPLWYFDEVNGYWKEEGQATLQGNMYIGDVSHFSFWNCDIPAEAVNLCISISDDNDNPLNNLYAAITSTTYGTRGGSSNEIGEVCGLIPSNETLELNIYNYDFCNSDPIYTQTIGPFDADSSIDVTVTLNSEIISETVTGTFNTCADDAVTNGYVQLTYGNQTFTDIVENGDFEINLLRCAEDNTFNLKGSDYDNLQSTDEISFTFATPTTDVGTINACNTISEFIQYTIDDGQTTYVFDGINATFSPSSPNTMLPNLTISGNGSTGICFYMNGALSAPDYVGTYDYLDFNDINDTGFFIAECINMTNTNNNVAYNLTALGTVGEFVDINFSGTYEDSNAVAHTINGVVHVLRDN